MSRFQGDPYRPCPCGSGEKYKFCCRDKDRLLGAGSPSKFQEFNLARAEELHRQSLAFIAASRGTDAIPLILESIRLAPRVSQPWNNLATAYYIEGDFDKAIETTEKVDRDIDPGNLYALGNLVHFYLMVGRDDEAERTLKRLSGMAPKDPSAAIKKCEALARYKRHPEILSTALISPDDCAFFAGTAFANLGRYDDAKRHLRTALSDPAEGRRARRYLELLERQVGPGSIEGDWPYLASYHWYHGKGAARLSQPGAIKKLPGLVHMAIATFNEDASLGEGTVDMLLSIGTPLAFDYLRKLAFGTFGPDSVRTLALSTLKRQERLGEGPHRVWIGGIWRDVRIEQNEFGEVPEPPLPPELESTIRDFEAATKSADWKRAEQRAREAAKIAPEWVKAGYLLGHTLYRAGRYADAVDVLREQRNRHAADIASAGLLMASLMRLNRPTEAQEVMKSTSLPERVDSQTHARYMLTCAQVGMAVGEWEPAIRTVEAIRTTYPDFKAARKIERSAAFQIARAIGSLRQKNINRQAKKHARVLEPDAPMARCYERMTVEELRSLGRSWGVKFPKGSHKEDLLEAVLTTLKVPERVEDVVRTLPEDERAALRAILDSDGIIDFTEFSRSNARPDRDEERAEKAMEIRLAERGFIVVATVGGRVSALIPRELRASLAAVIRNP